LNKKILVVGGGTAGWMCAAYLSVKGYTVTVIESERIPIVGVGESTLPAMNHFCQELGLDESDWMPSSHSIFKLGINHRGWSKNKSDFWHYFIYNRDQQETQHHYIDSGTLPPQEKLEYAYHVDANEFGYSIAKPIAFKNGCVHIVDHIDRVDVDESGIVGLSTESGQYLTADYYIDCTGWAKLLATPVGINYQEYTDFLNDRAIACPQEAFDYTNRYTITYRKSAGWIWEIALDNRRGVGYVYSSKYISDEQAIDEYCEQYPNTDRSKIRFLKFTPEKCLNPVHKNVVAVGLSAGFIEPLEATGLFFVQYIITGFHKIISKNRKPDSFNRAQRKLMDETYNYILCHYTLSGHDDTEYWRYYQELEKRLNTRANALRLAQQPDTNKWIGSSLFFPYNWWAVLDGYGILDA